MRALTRSLALGSLLSLGSCAAKQQRSLALDEDPPEPSCGQDLLYDECSMAHDECPSSQLARVSTELDASGWQQLRALAELGVVALRRVDGGGVELVEGCRLPGRYHEAAAAPASPGRAWSSDRLVYLPDEAQACADATHFVASFAIRAEADGEAIVLPLPCSPLGVDQPASGCVDAGLVGLRRAAEPADLLPGPVHARRG